MRHDGFRGRRGGVRIVAVALMYSAALLVFVAGYVPAARWPLISVAAVFLPSAIAALVVQSRMRAPSRVGQGSENG